MFLMKLNYDLKNCTTINVVWKHCVLKLLTCSFCFSFKSHCTQTLYRANLMRFELLRIFCNYLTCVLWDDLRCAIAPKNLSFMTQQASFFSPVWYEVVKSDWRITVYACRDGKSANKVGEFNHVYLIKPDEIPDTGTPLYLVADLLGI